MRISDWSSDVCSSDLCQKRTGSAFGVQARFPLDAVTIEGQSREYAQAGGSGAVARFRFCGDCGATVYWESDGVPGFVTVAVGSFSDPDFPTPQMSVYEERQQAWLRLPAYQEHFE